jgi:hypothetical protein
VVHILRAKVTGCMTYDNVCPLAESQTRSSTHSTGTSFSHRSQQRYFQRDDMHTTVELYQLLIVLDTVVCKYTQWYLRETMTINEQATMIDNLTVLEPVDLICAIQGLLLNNSSDDVRDNLSSQAVVIASDAAIPRNDTSFSMADLLESPFFIAKNLRKLPQVQTNASNRRLSGNISKTARAVLKNFYSYNVTFDEWTDFETLIDSQDVSSLGTLPVNVSNWGRMVQNLLLQTESSDMGEGTGEVQELTVMHSALRKVFAAFDFYMKVNNGSDDDVTCGIISTSDDFMFTEGKESACLPRQLCTDGHHLCSFGFATKLAGIRWKAPEPPRTPQEWYSNAEENNSLRERLQTYLKVGGDEPSENASTSVQPSDKTNAILGDPGLEIGKAVSIVHAKFREFKIEANDPVNLWAAVMQACHYSIKKGRAMTIVQSARMWWFVQLDGDGSCVVRISTAIKVGSRHFLTRVMKFLIYARYSATMGQGLRRMWEKAIARDPPMSAGATMEPAVATANEESNGGDSPRGQKRHRQSSTRKASSLSHAEQKCCESTATPTVSFDDEETDSCFGYDEFGMEIPWFDQIGDTLEVLGRGRSSEVTKVVWNAQPVALKTFILQFDDSRSLESVYEHELDVLRELQDLWGKHVPELLFHKPWPTSPMIGFELGEPLPDDMSKWSNIDLQKANESVQKIRELGWHQNDVRGANFVRLKGNKIAMIDFESMEKVPRADQA